jgi:hypothetical protein
MKRSAVKLCICIGMVLSTLGTNAASLFSEDFGVIGEAAPITIENTALTYARVGAGTGAHLKARNPGSFTGASASLLATSTSLTGLGVTNGSYPSFEVGTLAFSFRTPQSFGVVDDLYAFVGSGAMFSGNVVFNGNEVAAGFAIAGGQFRTRNSANTWEDIGDLLLADSLYNLHIVFNGSSDSVVYGADNVAAGKADVWLNGALFGNDISIRNATGASAFRIYTTGSAGATPFEIDNIRLFDGAMVVPEPRLLSFILVGGLLWWALRQRAQCS